MIDLGHDVEDEGIADTEVPRLSDDKLKELVLGIVDGRIFTVQHINPDQHPMLLGQVFIPIGLGVLQDWTPEQLQKIGTLYEYYAKALPRTINGYPMFTSCQMVHIEDWVRACDAIQAEQDRRDNIKV